MVRYIINWHSFVLSYGYESTMKLILILSCCMLLNVADGYPDTECSFRCSGSMSCAPSSHIMGWIVFDAGCEICSGNYYVSDYSACYLANGFTEYIDSLMGEAYYYRSSTCTYPRYPGGWQIPGSLSAGQKIYAADASKIRTDIDLVRADAGLGNCVGSYYSRTPAVGAKIYASDMNEMRACILQVYDACGVGRPATSVNTTAIVGSKINSAHWTDLWSAVANAP